MRGSDWLTALIQVLMAVFGALARMLSQREGSMHIGRLLSELFIAGFMGIVFYWISRAMALDAGWMHAASGIAGWVGPQVLDRLWETVEHKAGIGKSESNG